MASSSSVEYQTLVQCTEKLCTEISQDPLAVSNKLFESGLVSEAQVRDSLLQSKDNYSKASVLVHVVTSKVKAFPKEYKTFLSILNQFRCLQNVVNYVQKKHEALDPDHDDDIEAATEANITKLEMAHSLLICDVAKKLEHLNVNFQTVREPISAYIKEDLAEATTIADSLKALTSVTKWKCNSIIALEELCRKFGNGDKDLMALISDYKSQLAGFKATTKIIQFLRQSKKGKKEIDEIPADPPCSIQQAMAEHDDKYCHTLSVKLDARVTDKCLDYIDQLWASLVEYLFLPTLPALLKSICDGCIEVNWLIPTTVAQEIKAQAQRLRIVAKKYEIIQVKLDGETLYVKSSKGLPLKAKHYNTGSGPDDVLILVSSESLQGEDIVPRKKGCLTKKDRKILTSQGIPANSWDGDASLMEARYKRDGRQGVLVLGREEVLTCEEVKEEIRALMDNTPSQKVCLHYIGPGKKNSGDWCFSDGFIEFGDILDAYMEHLHKKGKSLEIYSDCSYSGMWTIALREFLDKPCDNTSKILLKMGTSCQSNQIPHTMLYSARGIRNDLNTGKLYNIKDNHEIERDQHSLITNSIKPTGQESDSVNTPCSILSDTHDGISSTDTSSPSFTNNWPLGRDRTRGHKRAVFGDDISSYPISPPLLMDETARGNDDTSSLPKVEHTTSSENIITKRERVTTGDKLANREGTEGYHPRRERTIFGDDRFSPLPIDTSPPHLFRKPARTDDDTSPFAVDESVRSDDDTHSHEHAARTEDTTDHHTERERATFGDELAYREGSEGYRERATFGDEKYSHLPIDKSNPAWTDNDTSFPNLLDEHATRNENTKDHHTKRERTTFVDDASPLFMDEPARSERRLTKREKDRSSIPMDELSRTERHHTKRNGDHTSSLPTAKSENITKREKVTEPVRKESSKGHDTKRASAYSSGSVGGRYYYSTSSRPTRKESHEDDYRNEDDYWNEEYSQKARNSGLDCSIKNMSLDEFSSHIDKKSGHTEFMTNKEDWNTFDKPTF